MISLSAGSHYGLGDHVYPTFPGSVFYFEALENHQFRYPLFAEDADHLWISTVGTEFNMHRVRLRRGRMKTQTFREMFDLNTHGAL